MAIDPHQTPLLTARETARHLKMPVSTLNVWLASPADAPLVHAVRSERRGWPRVPLAGIVEAWVLRALRESGMPMNDIRAAATTVRTEFNDPYALATRRIATDGVAVFARLADSSVLRARDRRHAIHDVLQDYLRHVDWDDTGTPIRLRLPDYPAGAEVVIDPRFGWGAPVLAQNKVKVEDVVALWRTGEPITAVAEEYNLAENVVEDVLRQAA